MGWGPQPPRDERSAQERRRDELIDQAMAGLQHLELLSRDPDAARNITSGIVNGLIELASMIESGPKGSRQRHT